jgi:regulator of sigma E protease
MANLLLAIAVYWGLSVFGVMEPQAVVAQPAAGTPAAVAGLRAGDRITAVDGEEVRSFTELNWLVLQRAVERDSVPLSVAGRDGVTRQLQLDLSGLSKQDLEGNPMPRIVLKTKSPVREACTVVGVLPMTVPSDCHVPLRMRKMPVSVRRRTTTG